MSKKVQAICLWWHKPVIDQELLQSLPNLKVIVNSGAGVDHLDLKLVASFGVKIAHSPCAVSSSTAERLVEGNNSFVASKDHTRFTYQYKCCSFVLDPILFSYCSVFLAGYHVAIYSGMEYCKDNFLGVKVTGTTLGIIGMGSTVCKTILRAKAFEMNVLYHNRTRCDNSEENIFLADALKYHVILFFSARKEQEEQPVSASYCETIANLLQQADYYFFSFSRDHPLLKLKNIIITPHIGSATKKTRRLMMEDMTESIQAGLTGLPIPNEVLL
ncbi:putative 2-ketogluconate reductase [Ara ararauna]